ncbi:toxic anion resistance protein TelA [Peptostreptococcus stomatis DSM 17678]|uniref:Toxic anion resistance protein TelA n=1 Tax=Peptostreptococcus stomatis DSM 17678 TaxID=596315 RepID=E0E1Y1_9FIRM|nr:toxic anion resistance protein [Peptostreptococcus stomatis]EFM65085.1 toxic anion resistance protein TelA [Peptostreptococcus stomatis DSM 17678]
MDDIVLSFDSNKKEELDLVKEDKVERSVIDSFDESSLSESERKMVEDFSKEIDIGNSQLVLEYGAGVQKKMSDFSDSTLSVIRTKDLGEVGDMISNLVVELKGFDASDEDKGILGFFKRGSKKTQLMRANYDKAENNVNSIVKSLENQQVTLMKDISTLDQMYDLNKNYYKEVSMYILAGKKKLADIKNKELPALSEKARLSGLQEDAQNLNDLNNQIDRFEKKLHDLDLSRMISIQTAPQIRMVQNNNILMVEKIQSTIVNTIPLWKNQMVLALGVSHSNEAIRAQREVSNITNELLKKNADNLKMASIETAKESERGIVDIESLKHTNETLISSLDEVMKIQVESRAKRKEAENEIARLENELKNKMIEMVNKHEI